MFKGMLYTGDERRKEIAVKDVKFQGNHLMLVATWSLIIIKPSLQKTDGEFGAHHQWLTWIIHLYYESTSLFARNTSKTTVISIVQNLPSIKRPQPRIPEYLRESFNLSKLSEHTSASEAVPRHLPPNFQAVVQPDNLPEPTRFTSSVSSNTSQTGFREIVPSKSSSRNPQTVSKKVHSGTKPVLLPPSSFVRTTKPVMDERQCSQGMFLSDIPAVNITVVYKLQFNNSIRIPASNIFSFSFISRTACCL
jgi:hypothetical protein